MRETDRLAVLLDEPEIRAMVVALGYSGPGGLHGVAAAALDRAGAEQRTSWLDPTGHNARLDPDQVPAVLGAPVVAGVAAYVGSDPAEVSRQLAQLLPDLLDALTPGGRLIPAADLVRVVGADIALDDAEAGPFGR